MLTNFGFAFVAVFAVFLSAVVLKRSFVHSQPEVIRQRALAGQVFLAEPIEDDDQVMRCGCLTGLPARYNVSGGWGANGSLCVRCVRMEFDRWVLYHTRERRIDGAPETRVAAVADNRG